MFHLTASTSEGCPTERSSCATTRARDSRHSTTATWSGCHRRRRHLTYVGSPGDVTDQLHGQVHGTELSCERLPSRWIGLSLTQQIIHEIHHVTSGNRHTLVDQFAASGPRNISFEMFHQTSGFGLHGLGNGVHDVGLYLASSASSRSSYCSLRQTRPRPLPRLVHRDHACRFLDVVPLQYLIIQCYLGPVVEVLSVEDGLYLVIEGLHLLT